MQIIIPLESQYCLLGLVEPLAAVVAKNILVSLLLFYARKAITMRWKQVSSPTLSFWMCLINSNLLSTKLPILMYTNRYPCKFQKIWSYWLDNASTAAVVMDDVH